MTVISIKAVSPLAGIEPAAFGTFATPLFEISTSKPASQFQP